MIEMNNTSVIGDEHNGGDNRVEGTLDERENADNGTPKPNRKTPSIFDPFFQRYVRPTRRYKVKDSLDDDEASNTNDVNHPDYTTPPKPARPDKPVAQLPQPKMTSQTMQPTESNTDLFSTPLAEVGELFTPKPFPKGAQYKEWINSIVKDEKMEVDVPSFVQYREQKDSSSDTEAEHDSSSSDDKTNDLSKKLEASFKQESKPITLRPSRFNAQSEQPSTSQSAPVPATSSSVPSVENSPLEQVNNEIKDFAAALRREGLSPSK